MAILLRRCRFVLVIAVLLLAVWLGLKEGLDGFRGAASGSQRIAALCQLLYGLLAVASLAAFIAGSRWLGAALLGWVVTLTLTGALAPVAWGGASWQAGLVAGTGTLIVAGLVAWGAVAHRRGQIAAAAAENATGA